MSNEDKAELVNDAANELTGELTDGSDEGIVD